MISETEFRNALLAEARTWLGTPYHHHGSVKGVGVNCAQFLFEVGHNAGLFSDDMPKPRWYSPQLASNSKEERLINYVEAYGGLEIIQEQVKPADIVVYKTGQSHGHIAMVVDWPTIIHVIPPHGCQYSGVRDGRLAQFSMRFYTFWKGNV